MASFISMFNSYFNRSYLGSVSMVTYFVAAFLFFYYKTINRQLSWLYVANGFQREPLLHLVLGQIFVMFYQGVLT